MTIRPATKQDLPAIMALERSIPTAPHWTEEIYLRMLRDTTCEIVVEDQNGLRGFCVASIAAGEAELDSVVVAQEARRRGVGRNLCNAVIGWARVQGARSISLEVRTGSIAATLLYRSLGFQIVGERKLYYADPPDDALIMRLNFDCDGV